MCSLTSAMQHRFNPRPAHAITANRGLDPGQRAAKEVGCGGFDSLRLKATHRASTYWAPSEVHFSAVANTIADEYMAFEPSIGSPVSGHQYYYWPNDHYLFGAYENRLNSACDDWCSRATATQESLSYEQDDRWQCVCRRTQPPITFPQTTIRPTLGGPAKTCFAHSPQTARFKLAFGALSARKWYLNTEGICSKCYVPGMSHHSRPHCPRVPNSPTPRFVAIWFIIELAPRRRFFSDFCKMYLKQIHYFIAIAEKGAISSASAHIHIAQPALSAQIAKLEEELGVALFTRHRRGVTLTEAGEIFLEHAYKVVEDIATARSAVLTAASQPKGEVTFGLPVTTSTLMTVPIVEQVRARYPDIKLSLVDGMSADVYGWLVEGRLDVAILYGAERAPPIQAKLIVNDELYLMGHENDLTRGRTEIGFRELVHFPLLHNSPTRSRLRQLMDETARKLGFPLTYAGEIDSVPQMKALVYRGRGFTVLPKIALGNDPQVAKLRLLRIFNPELRLSSYLALTPKRDPSRATLCIFDLVDDLARSLLQRRQWAGGHRATDTTRRS